MGTEDSIVHALVVEDDPSTQRLLREVLELRGYRVIPKQSAEEALEAFEQHAIALALIDWDLPGMNGLELCRQLTARGDVVYAACRQSSPELDAVGVKGGIITGVDVW